MNRCYLCKLEGESIDHILLHCSKAKDSIAPIVFFIQYTLGYLFFDTR